MRKSVHSLLGFIVLLSPVFLYSQGNPIFIVVPDGRTETDSIPANTNNVYLFATLPGHSYSIEQSRGLNRPTLQMFVGPACPGAFGSSVNDTSSMDPAVDLNTGLGQQRKRQAFACPGPVYPSIPLGQASINIYNSSATPTPLSITVTDTTLYSAKWGAGTNSDTFWTFTNTSSAAVNISINVVDSNGFAEQFPGFPNPGPMSIAAGATLAVDTTQIPPQFRANPPGGSPLRGSVLVTQDGPPGAILATAAIITNAGGPIPTVESVKFGSKNQ